MAAELRHADLEGDARARRRLLENHREALSAQRFVRLAGLGPIFDFSRQLEQSDQVVADVEHRNEVSLVGHPRAILRAIQNVCAGTAALCGGLKYGGAESGCMESSRTPPAE